MPTHNYDMLPTHVGMNRRSGRHSMSASYAPHARGDEPGGIVDSPTIVSCSPRTWG